MGNATADRLYHLRRYIETLAADGLLAPDDASCVLFVRVDDDRKRLALADRDYFDQVEATLTADDEVSAADLARMVERAVTPEAVFTAWAVIASALVGVLDEPDRAICLAVVEAITARSAGH